MARSESANSSSNKHLTAWHVELMRASFLYPSNEQPAISDLWRKAMGTDPDRVQDVPKQRVRQEFVSGEFGLLSVTQQPSRIDVALQIDPAKVQMASVGEIAPLFALGKLSEIQSQFVRTVDKICGVISSPFRIALAPIVIAKAETYTDALAEFRRMVPYIDVPDNRTDVFWQATIRVSSKSDPSIFINRLAKWFVVEVQSLQFAMGGMPAQGQVPVASAVTSIPAVRIEFDYNILGNLLQPLAANIQIALFAELAELIESTAANGEGK